MKVYELGKNEGVRVVSVYNIKSELYREEDKDKTLTVDNKAYNVIYTDGVLKGIENIETSTINKYYYLGKSMEDANTLISKDLYFEDYSYIIEYLVVNEHKPVISKPTIYVKDKNNRFLLKEVKEVLKELDYNIMLNYLNTLRNYLIDNGKYSINEEALNVYTLKKNN